MKLENQVCNLELAKQLKSLNVPQNSAFEWRKYSLNDKPLLLQLPQEKGIKVDVLSGKLEWFCSAFSVAELINYLPDNLYENGEQFEFSMGKDFCGYYCGMNETWEFSKDGGVTTEELLYQADKGETVADFLAKMLIWLIGNKYLDFNKVSPQ